MSKVSRNVGSILGFNTNYKSNNNNKDPFWVVEKQSHLTCQDEKVGPCNDTILLIRLHSITATARIAAAPMSPVASTPLGAALPWGAPPDPDEPEEPPVATAALAVA